MTNRCMLIIYKKVFFFSKLSKKYTDTFLRYKNIVTTYASLIWIFSIFFVGKTKYCQANSWLVEVAELGLSHQPGLCAVFLVPNSPVGSSAPCFTGSPSSNWWRGRQKGKWSRTQCSWWASDRCWVPWLLSRGSLSDPDIVEVQRDWLSLLSFNVTGSSFRGPTRLALKARWALSAKKQ